MYHAQTVKAHAKYLVFAAVLASSSAAFAQSGGESTSTPPASSSWPTLPNERHLLVRLQGGVGLRLVNPWGASPLSPPWIHAQIGFLFINAGPVRMGPTVGGQIGLDLGRAGVQGAPQVGWAMLVPVAERVSLNIRADVAGMITRGSAAFRPSAMRTNPSACEPFNIAPVMLPNTQSGGSGVDVPQGTRSCIGFVPGFEVAAGPAIYLSSGIALTAELAFSGWIGDSLFYPVLGLGLGLMIDYEMLR